MNNIATRDRILLTDERRQTNMEAGLHQRSEKIVTKIRNRRTVRHRGKKNRSFSLTTTITATSTKGTTMTFVGNMRDLPDVILRNYSEPGRVTFQMDQ